MSVTETESLLVNEGKTKRIMQIAPHEGEIGAKNDITAGDGKKHDWLRGKAELATATTSNVFKLLKVCGIPVAFHSQNSSTTFLAPLCTMLLWEVVVRREGHGSFPKRNPRISLGTRFEPLITEFYLKTKGRRWKEHSLPCDDPYAMISNRHVFLYKPDEPVVPGKHFLKLSLTEVAGENSTLIFSRMRRHAEAAFRILEHAWESLDNGARLVDFKVEFGLSTRDSELLLADVIDNDSWRVLHDGMYVDKQGYRDGDTLDAVLRNYEWVAHQVAKFPSFKERILELL